MKKTAILFAIILLGIVFALYMLRNAPSIDHTGHPGATGPVPPEVREQVLELQRLEALAAKHTITESDFASIEASLAENDDALDELGEIKELVKEEEYDHAIHSFAFLIAFLSNGVRPICPGHSLLHYYIYTSHGADELAGEQLEEAETNLPAFAASANGKDVAPHLQQDIDAIHAGTTTATNDELNYLNSDGGVCI